MNEPSIITLLTDFGSRDYYVGALKGTLLRLAPGARLVDLGHEIGAGDIDHAAFVLAAAAPTFPPATVHLAVVDPGVGSERRILAVRADHHFAVAPDNGLAGRLLDTATTTEVRSVERRDLFLAGPGETFHGRDRFAPVAAFLARGGLLADLGPVRSGCVRLPHPRPSRRSDRLVGRVVHVDRFGNLVTDLPSDWLDDRPFVAEIDGHLVDRRATHYAALPVGCAAVIPGSVGTLEIALRGESLAARWQIGRSAAVEIEFR